ncbi:hypothetical protein [Klebsiella oxytoca]|uniref:hypothetical protein n=1 Tax=Klebsiella oxytoca TaxID=571 RepID=UPI00157ACD21|nr:hypothetical protein [Klebsiella oxytoca]
MILAELTEKKMPRKRVSLRNMIINFRSVMEHFCWGNAKNASQGGFFTSCTTAADGGRDDFFGVFLPAEGNITRRWSVVL